MVPMNETSRTLRRQMVDRLRDTGVLVTPSVEEAMSRVPRDLFIPQVDDYAYVDDAVIVKRSGDGTPISSASQPTMVATMLEQLQVSPGHYILEVGTGTGYNAALLAALVGDDGHVVSVELEPDLAESARRVLAQLGEQRVEIVVGDGRNGYQPRAPYDRIIITAGASRVMRPWGDQLVDGGRLVVPLVDYTGRGLSVIFDKVGGELVRGAEVPCGFLPIRDVANG
jgi:protein-L-isoaspartate(D-aspartate) O-methyltransferase